MARDVCYDQSRGSGTCVRAVGCGGELQALAAATQAEACSTSTKPNNINISISTPTSPPPRPRPARAHAHTQHPPFPPYTHTHCRPVAPTPLARDPLSRQQEQLTAVSSTPPNQPERGAVITHLHAPRQCET